MADDLETPQVELKGSLDISGVIELQSNLRQSLQGQRAILIEATHVERADTAVLQLLCAFFREAEEQSVEIDWSGASDALCSAARQIGLEECLSLASTSRSRPGNEVDS